MPLGEHDEQRGGRAHGERGQRLHREEARDEGVAAGVAQPLQGVAEVRAEAALALRRELPGMGWDDHCAYGESGEGKGGRVEQEGRGGTEPRHQTTPNRGGDQLHEPARQPPHAVGRDQRLLVHDRRDRRLRRRVEEDARRREQERQRVDQP